MSCDMLCSSNISINHPPICLFLRCYELIRIFRIHISQPIPAWPSPSWHRIRLSLSWLSADRTCSFNPVFHLSQWSFFSTCWLIMLYIRQAQRQIWILQRNHSMLLTEHHRERFSPISLPRENSVLDFIVHFLSSDSLFSKRFLHFCYRFIRS